MVRSRWWTVVGGVAIAACILLVVLWKSARTEDESASVPSSVQASSSAVNGVYSPAGNGVESSTPLRVSDAGKFHNASQDVNVSESDRPRPTRNPTKDRKAPNTVKKVVTAASPKSANRELKPIDVKAHVARVRLALGKREIRIEKSDAFYFRNGRYFPLPYVIRREGYVLFFNDVEIFRHSTVPRWFQADRPPLPKSITAKSSWADVDKIRKGGAPWPILYKRWLYSHYASSDRIDAILTNVKRLPFIETAEWVPQPQFGKGIGLVRATSKAGDVREFLTSWWDPKKKDQGFGPSVVDYRIRPYDLTPFRVDEILKNLEGRIAARQKILTTGELAFIDEEHGWHFRIRRDDRRWKNIVDIVAILKSNASKKLKAQEFYRRLGSRFPFKPGYHPMGPQWELVKQIVRNYKTHPQLDRRVAELKKRMKLPDWKRPPEPQAQKIPPKLKNDPRVTPQGTIREALKALEAKQYQKYMDQYEYNKNAGKQTGEQLGKNKYLPYTIIALRNALKKKPVIDDIDDDVAYFLLDSPELENMPEELRGDFFKRLPLRRIGALWRIGY